MVVTGHIRVRLQEAPALIFNAPSCSACGVDCETEGGDGWSCPACGTTWGMDDYDQPGELHTGDTCCSDHLHLPVTPNDEAWRIS